MQIYIYAKRNNMNFKTNNHRVNLVIDANVCPAEKRTKHSSKEATHRSYALSTRLKC